MAAPLTKKAADGNPYKRPPDVEAQTDAAVWLSPAELRRRLKIANPAQEGFLRSETLIHLVRKGIAEGNTELINPVMTVLLKRCETNLRNKISDSLPTAEALREQILSDFAELLARDGRGESPGELDYYECRFNSAFAAFRYDRVRQETTRLRHFMPVESEEELDEAVWDDGASMDLAASLRDPDSPEAQYRLRQLVEAIEQLPKPDRDAVTLVCVMGYKVESEDPEEETAATKCNCSGRTIRNRLASASRLLAPFQEER